ncbi:putative pinoresinol-lariciresinol reductase 3 isoform X3 [Canna indica]|uniref:Pinoresinol-lariciresinol reductase 3 isoform X3 n=1 Tax=Canna indica TaxID=4628 RepID=A0AAQ3KTH6_9LILI|nr:putative pinoresinol-lariciresinol reductase 3 isoform X3 [Canna indica]
MDYDFYKKKAEIRRRIEKEGIPHTYISCNFLMRYLLPSLVQSGLQTPPRDKVKIFGDGNVKVVFVKDCDVAGYTICAIDDTRTLNKVLYLRVKTSRQCLFPESADRNLGVENWKEA